MKNIYVILAIFLTQLKNYAKIEYFCHQKNGIFDINSKFSFEPITADDISQQIKHLDMIKATKECDIPTKRCDNIIIYYIIRNFQ